MVACVATSSGGSRPSESFLSRSERLDHAERASTGFMASSGGALSEEYGHDEPGDGQTGVLSEGYGHDAHGVCLGDGQTESYLKDTGMTGLASAWAMARRL